MFDPELLNRNIARYRTMLTRDISEDDRRLIRVTLSDAETLAENRLLVRDTSDLRKYITVEIPNRRLKLRRPFPAGPVTPELAWTAAARPAGGLAASSALPG